MNVIELGKSGEGGEGWSINGPLSVSALRFPRDANAESIREAAERRIERKTEKRFQKVAVKYQGPCWGQSFP